MTPEGKAKKAILDALGRHGIWACRIQAGIAKVRGGWMHCAPEGTADILVMVPPRARCLWLEVKADKGKESDGQLQFAKDATRLGALVRTVRTPADAIRAYLEAVNDG